MASVTQCSCSVGYMSNRQFTWQPPFMLLDRSDFPGTPKLAKEELKQKRAGPRIRKQIVISSAFPLGNLLTLTFASFACLARVFFSYVQGRRLAARRLGVLGESYS